MRLKLIACEILYREVCAVVARSTNQVDVEFMPKGLHDQGQQLMHQRLAETLAKVDETAYDAVALGYGLCSNGVLDLAARTIPLVLPRAHDCITLFLGSKEAYQDYFFSHPGVYFRTTGWLERGGQLNQSVPDSIQSRSGLVQSYEELVARYGEDNAKYLQQQLGNLTQHYRQITFITTGVEPDDRFERQAREEATSRSWDFELVPGSLCLLEKLVDGRWDEEDFLVLRPGERVAAAYDERVVKPQQPPP
jgi:hypothetical protein